MVRVKTVIHTHLSLGEDDIDMIAQTNEANLRSGTIKALVLRCRVWVDRRNTIRELISEDLEAVFMEDAIFLIRKRRDRGSAAKIVRAGDSWYFAIMGDIEYTTEAFSHSGPFHKPYSALGSPLYKRYGPIDSQNSACSDASNIMETQAGVNYDSEVE